MAQRAKKPCAYIVCPKLTRDRYCEQHEHMDKEDKVKIQQHYDKHTRDATSTTFYNSKMWKQMRTQVFGKSHGLCDECRQQGLITPGNVVDHKRPLKERYDLRLTESNLWTLCHACHNKKTKNERSSVIGV